MIVRDRGLGFLPALMAALQFAKEDSTFVVPEDLSIQYPSGGYPPPTAPALSTGAVVGLSVGAAVLLGALALVLVQK